MHVSVTKQMPYAKPGVLSHLSHLWVLYDSSGQWKYRNATSCRASTASPAESHQTASCMTLNTSNRLHLIFWEASSAACHRQSLRQICHARSRENGSPV